MTMLQKLLRCNAMELTLAVAILASSLLVGFEVQLMSSKLDTSLPLACAGPPRLICPSEHATKHTYRAFTTLFADLYSEK